MTKERPSRSAVWWIAFGAAMWGLDGVFIVALLQHFSATQIVWLEHTLLILFAIPVLVVKRHELKGFNLGDWLAVLFVAWGGSALASILFTAGFHYGNVNVVLILQKLQPIFAVLLAVWVLKERLRRGFWAVLVAALAGGYLLTFGFHIPANNMNGGRLIGAAFALGAAFLWGGSTVMGKRLVNKISPVTMTALRFAVAFPLLLGIVLAGRPNWGAMAHSLILWQVWGNLLFQTLVPSLMSLLVYYVGLHGVRASHATIAELAFPATGLLVNWLFLHQTITIGQAVGFAVVWVAVSQLPRLSRDDQLPVPEQLVS